MLFNRNTVSYVMSAPVRALAWTLAVSDGGGVPSLSKMLAFAFAVAIMRDVWLHGATVTNVAAMALLCSVAFGRAVFTKWLERNTWSGTTTATTSASVELKGDLAEIAKVVTARRDHATSAEPTS